MVEFQLWRALPLVVGCLVCFQPLRTAFDVPAQPALGHFFATKQTCTLRWFALRHFLVLLAVGFIGSIVAELATNRNLGLNFHGV
jgi:hypothetical protein